mgnify:CR=1 FL=1
MAQVTIYMDSSLEAKIKEVAKQSGLSISKFIAKTLEQKVQNSWDDDIQNLSGSWSDFCTLEEIRSNTPDKARELF